MTPIERLQIALNGLGLKAVEARLESLLEQASKKEPSYADFLDELLSCVRCGSYTRPATSFFWGHPGSEKRISAWR
jgi:hypothetical protein